MSNIKYSNHFDEYADEISALPTNQNQPSHNELKIVDTLFKHHSNTITSITKEFKDSLILGLLFIFFSLPQVDELFKKYISITKNSMYMLLLVKAIFFIFAFWIIKNFNLLKKKT
jgi:hypothetical protein